MIVVVTLFILFYIETIFPSIIW